MKKLQLVLPLSFFVLLIGFLVGHLFIVDKKVSDMENRALQTANKTPTLEQIFSGEWFKQMETYFTDQFPLRDWWIKSYVKFQEATGKTYLDGKYYVDNQSGWMVPFPAVEKSDEELNEFVDELASVSNDLKELNIPFTYYALPSKATYIREPSPAFMPEDSGEKHDQRIQELLKERGIDGVQLMDNMSQDTPLQDMYFKTDHHWTIFGAYNAYQALITSLGERMHEPLKPLSFDEKDISCLPNDFAGSWNKIVYMTVENDDKACYIEPVDFSEQLTVYNGDLDTGKVVPLDEIYGAAKSFSKDEIVTYPTSYTYDYGELNFINSKPESKKHIVIIKDSYFNAIQPHVASHFERVTILDLRYIKKDLIEYMKELNPDYVILAYNDRNQDVYIEIE